MHGHADALDVVAAGRDPLVKATATLGLTLIHLGVMDLLWTSNGGMSRAITLPTDNHGFMVGEVQVTTTDIVGLAAGVVITVVTTASMVPPGRRQNQDPKGEWLVGRVGLELTTGGL